MDNNRPSNYRPAWLAAFVASALVVHCGVWFGSKVLERRPHHFQKKVFILGEGGGPVRGMSGWDGVWYADIARNGYDVWSTIHANIAFFPAYPLAGRLVAQLPGLSTEAGLVLVSNFCFVGVIFLAGVYTSDTSESSHSETTGRELWTPIAIAFWPTTVFCHMAYSESLFLLLLIAAMYGMQRGWPAFVVALIVGAVTGSRAVGVALVPVLALWIWRQPVPIGKRILRLTTLCPLAIWGIAGFMLFQHLQFGDALAFVKAQEHWTARSTPPPGEYAVKLLSFEPIWSVYVPSSEAYWEKLEHEGSPFFSLLFANPVYYVLTAALVVFGAIKGWLNSREWLLASLLLLIPYVTHAYQGLMYSQARYAASVFPVYLVLGRLACRAPKWLSVSCIVTCAVMLAVYSSLFAAWRRIF